MDADGRGRVRGVGRRRVLSGLVGGLVAVGCGGRPTLVGTDLGEMPAADFVLNDQDGRPFRLSEQRGKVVALTFLYTACPDICPLTAVTFRQVADALGRDGERVALVVVSVDPERDQPAVVRRYLDGVQLSGRCRYLVGSLSELGPVWASYGVAVRPGPSGTISHTDALYLLDRAGQRRVLLRSDVRAADLEGNLRALLR